MLISTTVLKNSIDRLNQVSREGYRHGGRDNDKDRTRCVACVVLGITILIIEVALLYFALDIAVNTTSPGAERFVHVILAVVITMPYLLFSVLLNPKATQVLKGDMKAAFRMCGLSSMQPAKRGRY